MQCRSAIAVTLAMLAMAPVAPAEALPPYRPIDVDWARGQPASIEWAGTWDETYEANVEKWEAELKAVYPERTQRERFLRIRRVRLLQAMVERFRPPEDVRVAAYERIADDLDDLGFRERSAAYYRRIVDEFPGRLEAAAEALHRIAAGAKRADQAPWAEYAAERLVALHEAGALPTGHPWVVEGIEQRLGHNLERSWLTEAWEDLGRLTAHVGEDATQYRAHAAELLYRAGRAREALAVFEQIGEKEVEGASSLRDGRKRYIEAAAETSEPVLPRHMELEARWDAFHSGVLRPTPAMADDLLASVAAGRGLLRRAGGLHVAMWARLRDDLAGRAALAGELRKAQNEAARDFAPGEAARNFAAVMAVFRRRPFARAAQRAMVTAGEVELRRGHVGTASRCFADVLSVAASTDVRQAAEAGVKLAGLQQAAAAFGTGGAPKPARPRRQVALRLPAAPAWAPGQWRGLPKGILSRLWHAHGHVVPIDGGVLVTGPNLLARYDDGSAEPTWVRTAHVRADWLGGFRYGDRTLIVPGPVEPALADGKAYRRWGLARGDGHPSAVAAFDLADGRMLWSTAGRDGWEKLRPICEPAVADGRVYVLAARKDVEVNTPISLLCLSADDGELAWQSLLAHQTISTRGGRGALYRCDLDLACYGAALTANGGSVYVSSSLGFVARCDGRDGLVEWTRNTPRGGAGLDAAKLVARAGIRPIVAGRGVVFAPRDLLGVTAVDRETGELLWEAPFVPSDGVAVAGPGRLIGHDGRHVCSLDAATGRLAWLRAIEGGVACPPTVAAASLHVPTPGGLVRLSADSGVALETAPWQGGRLLDVALRAGAAVGIGPTSQAHLAARPTPPAGEAPADDESPMIERERLHRTWPQLHLPDGAGGAAAPGRLYVTSAGVLECLSPSEPLTVHWRRLIAPGLLSLTPREGLLVAAYPDRIEALDAETGAARWRRRTDAPVAPPRFFGPYLALKDAGDTLNLSLWDVRTGKVLWRRRMGGIVRASSARITALGWDGKHVGVLLKAVYYYHRRSPPAVVHLRPSDGQIARTLRLPDDMHAKLPAAHLADGMLWYFGSDGKVHEVRLDGSARPVTYDAALPNTARYGDWEARRIDVFGPWICTRFQERHRSGWRTYVLKRGDPSYLLTLRGTGQVREGRYYTLHRDTLAAVDLASRKEAARYVVPGVTEEQAWILGYRERGGMTEVVSVAQRGRYEPTMLRVDRFDARTGRLTDGGDLPMRYWADFGHALYYRLLPRANASVTWAGERMLLATPFGLSVYGPPAAAQGARREPVHIAPPAAGNVEIDGRLDEWDASSAWPMRAAPGSLGRTGAHLLACHDARSLYLAASCPDDDARPWIGGGQYGGGDFLEIALETRSDRFRFLVGRRDDGRVRCTAFLGSQPLAGARAAVGHDAAAGRTVYELALPLHEIVERNAGWRRMALSARTWDELPPAGPTPTAELGRGLVGRGGPTGRHASFHLSPMRLDHERALGAIAADALALPECEAFLRDYCRVRHGGMTDPPPLLVHLLKAHARSPAAVRLMAMMDQTLRVEIADNPTAQVLAAAAAAGVPQAARTQYAALAGTYLSQWVRLSPDLRRQMVMIRLHDGREGSAGWDHRVYWGTPHVTEGTYGTPGLRRASGRIGSAGEWVELRVPLIWLDMHDKPLHGVSLLLWGRGGFDCTALVRAVAEKVLIDDDFPGARTHATFAWVEDSAHSGRRSLAKTGSASSNVKQDIPFPEPVTFHLGGYRPEPTPLDKPRAVAALKANLPQLGGSEHAWRLFQALLELDTQESDHARRAGLYRWFLQSNPDTPRTAEVLNGLRNHHQASRREDWNERFEADVRDCGVPQAVAYDYRLRYLSGGKTYVRSWQVIGPFGHDAARSRRRHPIEAGPVDLAAKHRAGERVIGWKLVETRSGGIDLRKPFDGAHSGLGYAACWVRAEKATPAVIEFGCDGLGEVWLDRRLVLRHEARYGGPRLARTHVLLNAGWTEVLLKLRNASRRWRFYFELVAPDGAGRPEGTEVTPTPPGR